MDDGSSNYKFGITAGEVIIGGKKIYVNESEYATEIAFSATSDRLYVGINNLGKIVFQLASSSGCSCSFDLTEVLLLAVINYNTSYGFEESDLRIFLNENNSPEIGCIYVSPNKSRKNFRDINSAIKYAKNISKISDKFGIPK